MLDHDISELVNGEPEPNNGNNSESVTEFAIRLLVARREKGIEKYGVELMTNNGRDALADAVGEAADLFLYLLQLYMEKQSHVPGHS